MGLTPRHTLVVLALAALTLAACGGGNDAEPRLIPSGGVGDGSIDGKLNVYVIDGDTDAPIASATVLVGEPGETPLEGITDSTGLITFESGDLGGPTTITVTADGYVVSTWMGANGANVTIPIDSTTAPGVPQAELRGTITGWDTLSVADNHILIASVNYSHTPELGDAANEIDTPQVGGGLGPNTCGILGANSVCDWRLNVRTGTIALFATIVDVDTKGTPTDRSDDTTEIVGFAFKGNVTVEGGVNQTGLALTQIDSAGLGQMTLTFPAAPAGLTERGALVGVDLGAEGVMNLAFVNPDESSTPTVPSLAGDFADASYRITAFANSATAGNGDAPGSVILKRGLTDMTIDLGAWMDQPSGLAAAAGTYSFTPVDGAVLHVADFADAAGETLWNVALFDGRSSFTLPGLTPNPLTTGTLTFGVSAFDGTVDLTDFTLDDFLNAFDRLAGNELDFTN